MDATIYERMIEADDKVIAAQNKYIEGLKGTIELQQSLIENLKAINRINNKIIENLKVIIGEKENETLAQGSDQLSSAAAGDISVEGTVFDSGTSGEGSHT